MSVKRVLTVLVQFVITKTKKEVSSIGLHTHVQYKNSVQINIFPGVINSSHRKHFFMTVQSILTKSNLDEKRDVHLLACKFLYYVLFSSGNLQFNNTSSCFCLVFCLAFWNLNWSEMRTPHQSLKSHQKTAGARYRAGENFLVSFSPFAWFAKRIAGNKFTSPSFFHRINHSGAPGARVSGAPWLGKVAYPSTREILVATWPYVPPTVRPHHGETNVESHTF